MRYLFILFLFFINTCFAKSIIIGDSNVGVLSHTKGFNISVGVNKKGIDTYTLINMLSNKIDTTYTSVYVAIGTNDCYKTDYSKTLYNKLHNKYPKAKLYIIWGSRGWGNVKHKSIKNQEMFYDKFEKNGFIQIKVTSGYFNSDKLAHKPNQKYHFDVIKNLN